MDRSPVRTAPPQGVDRCSLSWSPGSHSCALPGNPPNTVNSWTPSWAGQADREFSYNTCPWRARCGRSFIKHPHTLFSRCPCLRTPPTRPPHSALKALLSPLSWFLFSAFIFNTGKHRVRVQASHDHDPESTNINCLSLWFSHPAPDTATIMEVMCIFQFNIAILCI